METTKRTLKELVVRYSLHLHLCTHPQRGSERERERERERETERERQRQRQRQSNTQTERTEQTKKHAPSLTL
jgi:hypothetical protein